MSSKLKNIDHSHSFTLALFLSLTLMLLLSCSTVTYEKVYPTLNDGRYDSEFPYKASSEELERISSTVHRINTTAFYKTYIFHPDSNVTLNMVKNNDPYDYAIADGFADKSNSGTATCVYAVNGNVALLTCSHILNFADTIVSYFATEQGEFSPYIETISILERQLIYAAGFPDGSQMDLIVKDDKLDLAIIGRRYSAQAGIHFPVFDYPTGSSEELEWGTFVYVMGYPLNYKMITKAIVSSPNRDEYGSYLIDAVVNPGFSGGPVMAIRDGVPNFELVGIVQWVPEEEEGIVYPEKLKTGESYSPIVPYSGDVYVKKHSNIRYGIAKVISIKAIQDFVLQHESLLKEKGYYLFQDNPQNTVAPE